MSMNSLTGRLKTGKVVRIKPFLNKKPWRQLCRVFYLNMAMKG